MQETFDGLGIQPEILKRLGSLGFVKPTPIQQKAIVIGVTGEDLIGIAQTGTGKTLAFSIPMVQRLFVTKKKGLIIVPTRELAIQVNETLGKIVSVFGLKTAVLIGGEPINRQVRLLKMNPDIIVATPGRLIDHLQQRTVNLAMIDVLVLDEADRMLDMGFAPQIKKRVEQELFIVPKAQKSDLLGKLLLEYHGTVLVFSRTKHGAKRITQTLMKMGYKAAEIHSNRSLSQRLEALNGFKSGKYRVLVATDIAARGIDVTGIELVVNFDLPDNSEDYVHRIGRTARAGRSGKAISFACPEQKKDVEAIERLIRGTLPIGTVKGLTEAKFAESAPAKTKTKTFGRRRRY